jgi:hypothetical protein
LAANLAINYPITRLPNYSIYRVVPDSDAPLMAPASQTRAVEVGSFGLTTVRLEFDIGIR